MMRYKILKEKSERDIEPMIEDGENVERNSSEEIESLGMYIYVECVLLKLYIFIKFNYLLNI